MISGKLSSFFLSVFWNNNLAGVKTSICTLEFLSVLGSALSKFLQLC